MFFALGSLALCSALFAPALNAQSAQTSAVPPNRFLCIYDISAPVHRQFSAVQKCMRGILASRASGQLHYGDSLGVWSFDEELHAGYFPLQIWTAGQEDEILLQITEFLKQQPMPKASRLDKVMEGVSEVIQGPQVTTILLFSTGTSPMQGTPFDQEINDAYQHTLKDMKRDRMPIVTVLQARNGKFLKYTVNALAWPVVIPELPIPLKNVASTRMEKRESQTPVPSAAPRIPAPTVVASSPPSTQAPAPAINAAPAAPPSNSNPPPAPAPAPSVRPVATVPSPAPAMQKTAVAAPPVTPTETAAPPTFGSQSPNPPPVQTLALNPPPASSPPSSSAPSAAPPMRRGPQPTIPATMPPPAAGQAPAPAPIAALKAPEHAAPIPVKPAVAANAAPTQPAMSRQAPQPPLAPAIALNAKTNSAPVQAAVAIPPVIANRPRILLVAGVTLLAAALGLLFMTLRRFRGAGEPSLITQSINNLRK